MKLLLDCLFVAFGGMLGSTCRYLLAVFFRNLEISFPIGTLVANFLGCFIIGAIGQLVSGDIALSPNMRLFAVAGFCGGFTTMSSFIYESNELLRDGEIFYASLNMLATFLGCFLALYAGIMLAKLKTGV